MEINEKLVITESGFLTEFLNQHTQRTERPFCFILGAGASRTSGIPTGSEMATIWLREIYEAENFDGLPLEEWVTSERLNILGFDIDHLARYYPQLYNRRIARPRAIRIRFSREPDGWERAKLRVQCVGLSALGNAS